MAKDHRVLKALFEDRDPKQAFDIRSTTNNR
jgi:hypothetical protein